MKSTQPRFSKRIVTYLGLGTAGTIAAVVLWLSAKNDTPPPSASSTMQETTEYDPYFEHAFFNWGEPTEEGQRLIQSATEVSKRFLLNVRAGQLEKIKQDYFFPEKLSEENDLPNWKRIVNSFSEEPPSGFAFKGPDPDTGVPASVRVFFKASVPDGAPHELTLSWRAKDGQFRAVGPKEEPGRWLVYRVGEAPPVYSE